MTKIKLCNCKVEAIKEICASYGNDVNEAINVLRDVQNRFGYLPAEVQEVVAEELHTSAAKIYGIVSFYSFFTMTPKGEHPIDVCLGAACMSRGGDKILDAFQKELGITVGKVTADGKFSLNTLRCVGACAQAPVAVVGGKVYGKLTPERVPEILAEYK